MPYELSEQQRQAIELRGGNILVAAGAGSGKTTVLAQRVLALILDDAPKDIDRLLVLTFTNAAAAQMRERIEENLLTHLTDKPGDAHLLRQLAILQQAPITTIHAFCLDAIRQNFYHLGLDAGFRIPSEMERAILHEETMAAFLEQEYEKDDGILCQLANCYGGRRDDTGLVVLIKKLYDFSRSQPYPAAWLEQAAMVFSAGLDLEGYTWSSFLLYELRQELIIALNFFKQARDFACLMQKDCIPSTWIKHIEIEIDMINEFLHENATLSGFCAALNAISFQNLPRSAKQDDESAKDEFKHLRDAGKNAAQDLKKRFGQRAPQDMLADLHALAPLMERLCSLAIAFGEALDTEKRRRNLLDFGDMEHFCLRLLEDETNGVAAALRETFEELLIDEYQDINAVQERILQLLSRGDNVFAVGDVKQSIYRFRLAEPELFLHKYREYGKYLGGTRIDLNRNYRSTSNVIAAVNFLFRQLMSAASSELDYDQDAELKAGQDTFGAAAELWLLDIAPPNLGQNEEDTISADETDADPLKDDFTVPEEPALALEARLLGQRIQELQKEGYKLQDIAVLLRASKNRESLLVQIFADMGIRAVAGSKPDYLQTAEINLMLALLSIIDNPLQELELATVLRSPLYDFSLDELAQIRWQAPDEQLYDALNTCGQKQGELADKCRRFTFQLINWRERLRYRRVSELIGDIYRETGLMHFCGALPRGAHRQENLLLLQQRAREYEAGSYRGLFRFLLFLADGRGKSNPESSGLAAGEDAVRVMSIHKSKGLEFPVVIVANLSGAFALIDERQDISWHKNFGLGPKVVEWEKRRKFPSLAQEAIARRLHKEALAEEMRVLYVALTRAREKLILSGTVKDIRKTLITWYQKVTGQGPVLNGDLLLQEKRPLDWLGQALLRHPLAGELRQAANIYPESEEENKLLIPDISNWQINIVNTTPSSSSPSSFPISPPSSHLSLPLAQPEIAAVLSYRYPYRAACEAPVKWTVTELNKLQARGAASSSSSPSSSSPSPSPSSSSSSSSYSSPFLISPPSSQLSLPSALRGSVWHKLLQYLDFSCAKTTAGVEEQLSALIEQGTLSSEDAALVETSKIICFAASDLGLRLAASPYILREIPFTYALPAVELVPQAMDGEKLILQGIIDAIFWEEDGWVLLDYKTGGAGFSEQQLIEKYETQLRYYSRALQDIRQETLKEAWLCFVDLGKNIALNPKNLRVGEDLCV
ncbi:MAG: helicase-exonuclease AddAB subunit AddA [Clostridiales bacterium]|nr:helicase-exonuclease AddAB subunit AddA [Clostridiales bacterium]